MMTRNMNGIISLLTSARDLARGDSMTETALDLTGKLISSGWEDTVAAVLIAVDKVATEHLSSKMNEQSQEALVTDVTKLLLGGRSEENKERAQRLKKMFEPTLGDTGVVIGKVIEQLTELHMLHLQACPECRKRVDEENAKKGEQTH